MIGADVMFHFDHSVEYQLILHCAPVIKGVKAANTITLQLSDLERSAKVVEDIGIRTKTLYQNNVAAVVLFYRVDRLLQVMNQVAYCSYLLQLGYRPLDLEECFGKLRIKMYEYHKIRRTFPHELGVFLEYPLYDIKEFMKQGGKNSKICGYWKVYDREDYAKSIFSLYDEARNELFKQYLITGKLTV